MDRLSKLTDVLAKQCESVLVTLNNLSGQQDGALGSEVAGNIRPLDLDQLLPLLKQLMSHLQSRNLAARRLSGELERLTQGTDAAEEFAEILQLQQQLRFEAAQKPLELMIERHQWNLA